MVHEITDRLEQLPEKLTQGETLDFFIASTHRAVSGGTVHGFGIIMEAKSGRQLSPVQGASDTELSSAMRGYLGGTLTALEWATKNCHPSTAKRININAEYVYKHLPEQIDKWVNEPRRENSKILVKIRQALVDANRESVFFVHLLREDGRYSKAMKVAEDAVTKRVELVNSGAVLDLSDDDDFDDHLFRRALSKDQ